MNGWNWLNRNRRHSAKLYSGDDINALWSIGRKSWCDRPAPERMQRKWRTAKGGLLASLGIGATAQGKETIRRLRMAIEPSIARWLLSDIPHRDRSGRANCQNKIYGEGNMWGLFD